MSHGNNCTCCGCSKGRVYLREITRTNEKRERDALITKERLEYLREEIIAERISYKEIAELQDLRWDIDPSDTLLLEWAGVKEGEKL